MALNVVALHRMLWEASGGPHHTVCVEQTAWCQDLVCSPPTLNRALRRMVAAGRLEQLTTDRGPTPRTYAVSDPDRYASGA